MFLIEDKFSRLFQSGNFILDDFCKQNMNFLTMDKIFVLDNLNFVQDKIFFVRADGRGINAEKFDCYCFVNHSKFSWWFLIFTPIKECYLTIEIKIKFLEAIGTKFISI